MKNWIIILLMALTIPPIGNSVSMTSQSSYDYSFTKQLNVQESYQLYSQIVDGYANLSVSVNANAVFTTDPLLQNKTDEIITIRSLSIHEFNTWKKNFFSE